MKKSDVEVVGYVESIFFVKMYLFEMNVAVAVLFLNEKKKKKKKKNQNKDITYIPSQNPK